MEITKPNTTKACMD